MGTVYTKIENETQKVFQKAGNVFFLVGSGISNGSGIPTFRGIGEMEYFENYPAMYACSKEMWERNPSLSWRFFRHSYNLINKAEPNAAHYAIAKLQSLGKDKGKNITILTLTYDGLLTKAGVTDVIELHGNMEKAVCSKCNKVEDIGTVINNGEIPKCSCAGVLRPNIVLLDELVDEALYDKAINAVEKADLFILIGCSGVQQHSGDFLLSVSKDKPKIEINPMSSYLSRSCTHNLKGKAEDLLPQFNY